MKVHIKKGGPGSGHRGHKGRLGKRGGSVPGTGGTTTERIYMFHNAEPLSDQMSLHILGEMRKLGPDSVDIGDMLADPHADNILNGHGHGDVDWTITDMNPVLRGRVKSDVIADLAQRSGLPKEEVNTLVHQWAESANDNDMRSLSLQEAASEEFDVPMSDWQYGNIGALRSRLDPNLESVDGSDRPITSRENERAFLRAAYDATQERLAAAGLAPTDTVRLFRGVGIDENIDIGDTVNVNGNVMESWSAGHGVAVEFANQSSRVGVVLAVDMPVSSIISTAITGPGCLPEGEYICIGGDYRATVAYNA